MKPDKFEIFSAILLAEANMNHYGIYISIGQMSRIMAAVNHIYNNYDIVMSMNENLNRLYNRNISPLGNAGSNRL